MVVGLTPQKTILRSNHVSNFLDLTGSLPKDRERLISDLDIAIACARSIPGYLDEVPVYGITFDTNKAEVKPESTPSLEQIARLLKQDPALRLKVVGHTDMVGALDANMKLSQARAEAVVQALVSQHGIAVARLKGFGVGPLAPVASNDSEEGRARNRRVEIVKE